MLVISDSPFNPNDIRAMENRPPYAGGDVFENPNTSTSGAAAPPADVRPKPKVVA